MPRNDDNSLTFTIKADAEPAVAEIRRVRAEMATLTPKLSWPLVAMLSLIAVIDLLSPYGSLVFLPKPIDTVIDVLWIALNGAAMWCAVVAFHTRSSKRSR